MCSKPNCTSIHWKHVCTFDIHKKTITVVNRTRTNPEDGCLEIPFTAPQGYNIIVITDPPSNYNFPHDHQPLSLEELRSL
jgi:hypothetical protein